MRNEPSFDRFRSFISRACVFNDQNDVKPMKIPISFIVASH